MLLTYFKLTKEILYKRTKVTIVQIITPPENFEDIVYIIKNNKGKVKSVNADRKQFTRTIQQFQRHHIFEMISLSLLTLQLLPQDTLHRYQIHRLQPSKLQTLRSESKK